MIAMLCDISTVLKSSISTHGLNSVGFIPRSS
jgi:hypothetical protein